MKYLIKTFSIILLIGCQVSKEDAQPRLNHVQLIGSHNSYKVAIERPLMDLLVREDSNAIGLDYAHFPLAEQLSLGIRGLELDVLYDPYGGAFTQPKGLDILDSLGIDSEPYDTASLKEPGFKVFHIPDIDFRSHCLTFKGCLNSVKEWSMLNPKHIPIIITINPKNSGVRKPGFTKVIPFNQQVLDILDKEILAVFEEDQLITPKLVKGSAQSLRKAILAKGWPDLSTVRGQILFVLDAGEKVTEDYLLGNDFTKPMFVNVEEDHPHAGFFIMNDPISMEEEIKERVNKGFMVRTRSDANTKEARSGDYTRYEAAKRSGAHLISTDYYLKELSPSSEFQIKFENDSYIQCNSVLTDKTCTL